MVLFKYFVALLVFIETSLKDKANRPISRNAASININEKANEYFPSSLTPKYFEIRTAMQKK